MKYFIRTTGERTLDKSYNQIDYKLLIDTNHNAGKAFIKWLEQYFVNEDCVILEDDLILCKNFKNRIESVINDNPTDIINFYENGFQYFPTHKQLHFQQNQCTYYPKEKSLKILKYIKDNNYESSSCSELIRTTLNNLNIEHLIYRPILVQHLDYNSLMGHHSNIFRRSTPYFIDYLDELNINYNCAENKENRIKLKVLMKNKLEEYDKKFKDVDNK